MEEKQLKDGKVMINDIYGFTIDDRCYPLFKMKEVTSKEDGSKEFKEVQMGLYPTTVEQALKLICKDILCEKTAGMNMSISELHRILNEIKAEIKSIGDKLSF